MLIGSDGESVAPPPPRSRAKTDSIAAPHGASAIGSPHATGSSVARVGSSSLSFDNAVQEALAARTNIERRPAWTYGYETASLTEPGDTLYDIALAHGDTLATEEADNTQIRNPNALHAGQVVFSPGTDPVSPATTALIQTAERGGSQQDWVKVQVGIESDLRVQGQNKHTAQQDRAANSAGARSMGNRQ